MGKTRIDKSKRVFTYEGEPQSYWKKAAGKNLKYIPKNEKESEASKQRRKKRDDYLKRTEDEIRKRRILERSN